jgi:hypothetical protein
MSVSTATSKVQYTLSSGAQALPVTFYFLDDAHVQAFVDRSGVPLELVLNTDYTLTGAGDTTGGTLTTIAGTAADLVATDKVTIRRNVPITQLVNYVYNDSFPAETHEQALDKLTMICQVLNEALDRTIQYPATEVGATSQLLPSATTRANAVLTFDEDGVPDVLSKQELIDDLSLLDPAVTIGTAGRALLALESIATMELLGRTSAGSGNAESITVTAAGLGLLQQAFSAQATSFTAEVNTAYWITGNSVVVTLPAAPADGDMVRIANGAAVTGCSIARNGKTIMGVAEDLTVDVPNFSVTLIYRSATTDWRLV